MGRILPDISSELATWLHAQPVFFVATAPLADGGHISCSPKGGDTFRVLGPLEVAYLDYTGSGAETAAHVRENGRIVLMFCAFTGSPRVVRLHGRGSLVTAGHARYAALAERFPANAGTRGFIHVAVHRVSSACGMSVPLMDFRAPRPDLDAWAARKGPAGLATYRGEKNARSIDGLPAFD